MLKQDCLRSTWRLYTKTLNCMLKELLQSREQKVLPLQESMLLKLKRLSSVILRIGSREALLWKGWNFTAADVGKKDTEASIVQPWGKIRPECSSSADYVAGKGIIAEHVASRSQRKSSSDNHGTAADVVKRDTTAATALDLLMWILVLLAIRLTELLVLIQVFIHVVSA